MEKKVFLNLVLEELKQIKRRATKEEISRLDFENLNVETRKGCIYGQLTGVCDSDRAREIYSKAFSDIPFYYYESVPSENGFVNQYFDSGSKYTPLEKYLFMVNPKKHDEIIKYLKGEISEIALDVI